MCVYIYIYIIIIIIIISSSSSRFIAIYIYIYIYIYREREIVKKLHALLLLPRLIHDSALVISLIVLDYYLYYDLVYYGTSYYYSTYKVFTIICRKNNSRAYFVKMPVAAIPEVIVLDITAKGLCTY